MATIKEVLDGLNVLEKYQKGRRPLFVNGEHDIITVDQVRERDVSAEDKKLLEHAGWHFDEEVDAWARFT